MWIISKFVKIRRIIAASNIDFFVYRSLPENICSFNVPIKDHNASIMNFLVKVKKKFSPSLGPYKLVR